jgi:predicted TIM-barrel fold metal-dependent hydrolase
MKTRKLLLPTILVTSTFAFGWVSSPNSLSKQAPPSSSSERTLLRGFAAIDPIDSHTHVYRNDPAFNALLKRLNLHIVDIAVIDDRDPFFHAIEPQLHDILEIVQGSGGHASLCTTFSPYPFEQPGFAQNAIRRLDRDFSEGAVAVKIYKTIGMEIKSKSGKYLMPDDPAFEPIYRDIAAHNKTVIAHIAEPTSCWQPPNPASIDYGYYKKHPDEYAYLHPQWPSKATILRARDHMLEENPNLRVVGAHLGSMELNVDDIAKHFDRYPNFAVDTAARVGYLMLQPREKVRAFIIKYQDRVLYGTDLELNPQGSVEQAAKYWQNTYAQDWKYFATDEVISYQGHNVRGLALPPSVLRKLYHDNAVKWFPDILSSSKVMTSANVRTHD